MGQIQGIVSPIPPETRPKRWQVIGGLMLFHGYTKGAEIGVGIGQFTNFLCKINPLLHMYAVDLWAAQPGNDKKEGGESYEEGWNHEANYERFRTLMEGRYPERVTIIRDRTVEAAKAVPDGSLDFVFIDADHSYDAVLADYAAWAPKVRKDGLISGHDTHWPTVARALDKIGGTYNVGDNCWIKYKEN